jgi:hypothetical protein
MAQITIYLPDELEEKARRAAKAAETSVSKWIAGRVQTSLEDSWPQAVLDAAGAVPDFLDLEKIRRGDGVDSPRESFD